MGSRIIRFVGIFLTILGFYLLFAPVIAILKFIPLVGWLLASIVSIAALLFADFFAFLIVCFLQKVLDLVLFQQLALLVVDLRKGLVLRLDVNACVRSS